MSNPTTSSFWNQTTPAVPTGDQPCVIQSDGVTPQDSRTVYPKTATNTLRGVVKPDTTTITVDGSGNLSAKPMVGDTGSGGAAGIVPAPPSGSAAAGKYLKADGTFAVPAASGSAGGDLGGSYPNPTVTATHLAAPLPVVQGGTGTATPGIVAGTNVTVSGAWPNQTVNSSAGSTLALKHDGTANGSQSVLNLKSGTGILVSDDGSGGVTIASTSGNPSLLSSAFSFNNQTSASISRSITATGGTCLLVILTGKGDLSSFVATGSTAPISDTAGNTWTYLTAGGFYPSCRVWVASNCLAGATTVTVTASSIPDAPFALSVFNLSNIPTSSVLDVAGFASAHSPNVGEYTTLTAGPVTTANASDVLFALTMGDTTNTAVATTVAGFTAIASQYDSTTSMPINAFVKNVALTGSYSAVATWSLTEGRALVILLAIKATGTTSGGGSSGVTSFNGRTGAVVPASGDYTAAQVTGAATQAAIQQESYIYSADTGAANAYAVTLSPVPTVVAGSVVCFKAANTNTAASTLAVNGGTATAIRKNGTTVLAAGDIAVGQIIDATYDGTYWQIIVPGTGGGSSISLTTTGSSGAATLTGSVLNIPVYSGGGGSSALSASSAASPSTLNVTTEGTADWFVPNSSTILPRLYGSLGLNAKIAGATGGMIYNSFEWVAGGNSVTLFTQNFTKPSVSSTGSDGLAQAALSSAVGGQGLFSSGAGALNYGFRLAVPATTTSNTLRIYCSVFSGTVTATATFSDGSVSPATATIVATAGAANESYFTITYTGAQAGVVLYVTALLTANLGSGPNIKFMGATLA